MWKSSEQCKRIKFLQCKEIQIFGITDKEMVHDYFYSIAIFQFQIIVNEIFNYSKFACCYVYVLWERDKDNYGTIQKWCSAL